MKGGQWMTESKNEERLLRELIFFALDYRDEGHPFPKELSDYARKEINELNKELQ